MTTILVVDDVGENRYLLVALLQGNGLGVVPAADGAEALRLARASPPDLVVTDLMMPVMDGFELCRRWKRDEVLKRIPLVVYTATYTDPKDERLALSLGADRFLVKPQTPEVLLQVVQDVLAASRRDPASVRGPEATGDAGQLEAHNEALGRKLEKKVRDLEAEVAQRAQVEAELREKGRTYRLLAENALDVVWAMGFDGRFTYVSPAVEKLQGYTPAEAKELPLGQFIGPTALQTLEQAMVQVHDDLAAGRTPVWRGLVEFEFPRKDGSTVWTEVLASVMRDDAGSAIGIQGVTRDITARKRAELALKESEGLLRIAGRIARLGGWSAELKDGRVRWSDEVAAIHEMPVGHSPTVEEEIGFFAPERQARMRAVFETCAREGTPFDEETEILTARGRRVWVRTSGEALRDATGTIRKVQGAFQDITDRKQAEEEQHQLQRQLVQSQKIESVGRLAGGVAHDFNNLLAVVLSYVGFAHDAVREGDPLRADLEEVRKAAERAAALTRQLLAFSRKQLLEPEVLDLNAVVSGVGSMLRRLLGEDIEVEVKLAEGLGRVQADPGQLEQVLMNLAVNSRDAMPRGGSLLIETANADLDEAYVQQHVGAKPGPCVMLSVSDTGTGLDAAAREHLFEPFFTTKEKGKGTGLGLSTVFGIVKQSGGSIWVYSEPERGTTFKIYLPRVEAPVTGARRRPAPVVATGTETVLLVEDEEAVRRIAERILRSAGYEVLAAAGAGEALLLCEAHAGAIDLLLTDVVMPQVNGTELARRVAELVPKVKVLYMSGYTDDATVHNRVLDPGARFLGKPFSAADLTRKVREVLDE